MPSVAGGVVRDSHSVALRGSEGLAEDAKVLAKGASFRLYLDRSRTGTVHFLILQCGLACFA